MHVSYGTRNQNHAKNDKPAPHGMRFTTRRQAKDEVVDWLRFYNHRRLHSTLGYLSPMAFERKRLGGNARVAA
ncbi:MAG: transposase [Hyphomicrobiales bacterium]|nr:transposase [Hyphomicrobiales bacterium]